MTIGEKLVGLRVFTAIAAVLIISSTAIAQVDSTASSCATSVQLPHFDVASIKPVDLDNSHTQGTEVFPGGRILLRGLTLKVLVQMAYDIKYWQISGGDSWITKREFDIEAKPSSDYQSTQFDTAHGVFQIADSRLREMLQALLIDRFKLKVHCETKSGAISILVRNSKPLKLTPAKNTHTQWEISQLGGGEWFFFNVSMSDLASFVSSYIVHHPVINQTGIVGAFDYKTPSNELDLSGGLPDVADSFPRMLNEIGFKLVPSRGPIQTLFIDYAELPSPN